MRQAKWLHAWRSHSVAPQRVQLPRIFFRSGWEELLAAEEGGPMPSWLPKEAEGREIGVEEIVEVGAVGETFGNFLAENWILHKILALGSSSQDWNHESASTKQK